MVKPGDTIAVWFSCGAASAVAAKKTIEKYGDICTIRLINNPIKEEDEDNQRFLRDCEKWLGVKMEYAINSKYPNCSIVEVFDKRKYMSGIAGAPCTGELKKKARQQWEKENHCDWIVLGFTIEEKHRHERFALTERENILPILIEENITRGDCFRIISESGIVLPRTYRLGFANANCDGCVKVTNVTYWQLTRKHFPEVFKARAEQSRRIGCKLVQYKGERLFLDELPENAVGRPLKDMDFECGIFCMEQPEEETCDE